MEYNLVEVWLRRDPVRWIAGALGGFFACIVASIVAMFIAQSAGLEFWFPIKLMGTLVAGPSATEIGFHLGHILTGAGVLSFICVFWGIVYAHFTGTNSLKALLPMGLVWGIFSWIFTWNLFLQSSKPIFASRIPSGAALPVCLAYGLALASVSFFDCALRGKSRAS